MHSPVQLLKFQPNWPTGGRATGRTVWQLRQKMAKIIDFFQFFSRCSRTPRCTKMNFESSVAIPSPISLPKFQPNLLTGGRAIGRTVGQLRQKMAKIIDFFRFFRRCSHTPCRIPMKFESSVAIYSPVHLLKFQSNRLTGGRAIARTVRPPMSFWAAQNHFFNRLTIQISTDQAGFRDMRSR